MNILKQLIRSLYSPKDISTFRFQGIGKTILFLFLLTLISVIPTITYVSKSITDGLDLATTIVNEELPDSTISDGELVSDLSSPLKIEKGDFTIYFDSTGGMSNSDLEGETNALGLLQNEFVLVAGGSADAFEYATLTDFSLSKEELTNMLTVFDGALAVFLPVLAIIIYLFSSAVKFVEVSVLALFGLLLVSITKRPLRYRQLWRISAYSVTLPTIFFMIMEAIKTNVPGAFLLNWVVSLTMLYLVLKEIPQSKKQ